MTRKDYLLMLCLVAVSGLIGGSITSWLVSGQVTAQAPVPANRVVQTESLQIVDANGNVRIELSAQPSRTAAQRQVYIYDKDGNMRSLPDSSDVNYIFPSKARVEIRGPSGKVIWSAPPETEAMFVH